VAPGRFLDKNKNNRRFERNRAKSRHRYTVQTTRRVVGCNDGNAAWKSGQRGSKFVWSDWHAVLKDKG
jgi:hypothetical protein